jgi:hypothetical protein
MIEVASIEYIEGFSKSFEDKTAFQKKSKGTRRFPCP